jgi:hypothetical protein
LLTAVVGHGRICVLKQRPVPNEVDRFAGQLVIRGRRPSAIDIFENTVGEDLIVSRNDATYAYEPTFVGSNFVLHGDLSCRHNIPDVVDDPPGGPYPNTVVEGEKIGQCAEL